MRRVLPILVLLAVGCTGGPDRFDEAMVAMDDRAASALESVADDLDAGKLQFATAGDALPKRIAARTLWAEVVEALEDSDNAREVSAVLRDAATSRRRAGRGGPDAPWLLVTGGLLGLTAGVLLGRRQAAVGAATTGGAK